MLMGIRSDYYWTAAMLMGIRSDYYWNAVKFDGKPERLLLGSIKFQTLVSLSRLLHFVGKLSMSVVQTDTTILNPVKFQKVTLVGFTSYL